MTGAAGEQTVQSLVDRYTRRGTENWRAKAGIVSGTQHGRGGFAWAFCLRGMQCH